MKPRSPFTPAVILAFVVLVAAAISLKGAIAAYGFHLTKKPIYPADGRTLISSLPTETPNWKRFGSDRIESAEVVEELGTENYINRTFVMKDPGTPGRPIVADLHAAYYTGMIDTVPHVPDRCLIGNGWQMSSTMETGRVQLDPDAMSIDTTIPEGSPVDTGQLGHIYTMRIPNGPWSDAPGRRVRLPRDVGPDAPIGIRYNQFSPPGSDQQLFAGYFFIANGGTVSNPNSVRTLAFDLRNDYAFYMKVQVTTVSAQTQEEYFEIVQSLLNDLMPELMRCVPDWVEVELGNHHDQTREGSEA